MTLTETQFLALMRAAFAGGEPLPADADYNALFALAQQQKLLPVVFETVSRFPAAEEHAAMFATAKKQSIAQVFQQTMRTMQFSALYGQLRAAGLHPLVVKGQLCSGLYPWADHRLSGDDDLLIPDGELAACHQALLAQGLTTDCPEERLAEADEITYVKEGSVLRIELHRRLFDSSEDAHDALNEAFADIHDRAVEVDGLLTMPPHEHLRYLILHAYKHFVRSGIGLRQFCDIGLWARAYHAQIDWELLQTQCRSAHAGTFAAVAFAIAREWLGIAFPLPELWETAVPAQPLLHDTLCGGVYGTSDLVRLHSATVTLNAVKSSRTGRRSSVLSSLFPNRRYLAQRYPYVQKTPLLLPVAWGQRLAGYLRERPQRGENSAAASLQLARERIALMELYEIIE